MFILVGRDSESTWNKHADVKDYIHHFKPIKKEKRNDDMSGELNEQIMP